MEVSRWNQARPRQTRAMMILGLAALLPLMFSSPALGQGHFFLNNRIPPNQHAPFLLLDPETEEPFLLRGSEWQLDAVGGPRGTPTNELKRLPELPTEFRRGAASGYLAPRMVTVPGVASGQEATIELFVYHQERPEIKIPFGVYHLRLGSLDQMPTTLPLGVQPITNVAPKALAEFLPRRPPIPGEFMFKGKRLSYWLSRSVAGPGLPGRRTGRENRQETIEALNAAGTAAVPVLLQYVETNPEFGSRVVRQAADHLVAAGLGEELQRLTIEALASTNTLVQRNALAMLPCPAADAQLPTLAHRMSAGAKEVRQAALETLNRCELTDARLLPGYQNGLENGTEGEQELILRSLKKFGASAKSVTPAIEALLEKGSPLIQVRAASAVWSIERSTNAVAHLVQVLKTARDFSVVIESLQVLGEMGPAAQSAVPAILDGVEAAGERMGFGLPEFLIDRAAEALRKIQPGSEKKLPKPRIGDPLRPGMRPRPGPPSRMPPMPLG